MGSDEKAGSSCFVLFQRIERRAGLADGHLTRASVAALPIDITPQAGSLRFAPAQ